MKKQMAMDMLNDNKESNVGKMLIDQTTRKMVISVFIIILTFPLFITKTYIREPDSMAYGMELLFHSKNPENSKKIFDEMVDMQRDLNTPLLYMNAKNLPGAPALLLEWKSTKFDYKKWRVEELLVVRPKGDKNEKAK